MSLAALLLTAFIAQTPDATPTVTASVAEPATATSSQAASQPALPTASPAASAASRPAAPAEPTVEPKTAAASKPSAPPKPAAASKPPAEPKPATASAGAATVGPVEGEKKLWLAWTLSFALGLGIGNWYADAPGHAIFVAVGEIAGLVMVAAGDGAARSAGLVTFFISWALDWSGAVYNAKAYNEKLRTAGRFLVPTTPEVLADTPDTLPQGQQISVAIPF